MDPCDGGLWEESDNQILPSAPVIMIDQAAVGLITPLVAYYLEKAQPFTVVLAG